MLGCEGGENKTEEEDREKRRRESHNSQNSDLQTSNFLIASGCTKEWGKELYKKRSPIDPMDTHVLYYTTLVFITLTHINKQM